MLPTLRAARPQQHAVAVGVARSDSLWGKIAAFLPRNWGALANGLVQAAVAPMAAAISRKARPLMVGIGRYLTQADVPRLDAANLIQEAARHLFKAVRVFQKGSMSTLEDLQAVIGKCLKGRGAEFQGHHQGIFGPGEENRAANLWQERRQIFFRLLKLRHACSRVGAIS
jgi:hypothetical protein